MKRYVVEPRPYHDRVAELCLQLQIPKACGKAGGMLNKLSGRCWIPNWEARVVMATVTKAQTLNLTRHSSYVLQEADCNAEMARQPAHVRVIKTEMASQEFRVRVELRAIPEFSKRDPNIR